MKKKVLIHSIVFSPDGVSTAYLYNDIALGLVEKGFEVMVLTTTPHYNIIPSEILKQPLRQRLFGIYSTSAFQGIKVIHVPLKKYKSTALRIISFIYWHIVSLFIGLFSIKFDYILSPSPPLSIGLISAVMAKLKGAKSIYNVQEIYPDLLINQGNIKSLTIINALKRLEKLVYNQSDAVTTIDSGFYDKLYPRFLEPHKLHLIPNFVDTELYRPIEVSANTLPKEFPVKGDKFVMMYAGNIGFYQDWDPVLSAAQELKGSNVEFWIIGEGVSKKELEEKMNRLQIDNIRLFNYQPRHLMPLLNNIADAHFIVINDRMQDEGFPSKIYTIMACAKPMIVVSGEKSPLFRFLEDKDCALLVSSLDKQNFASATRELMSNAGLAEELGSNGLNIIKRSYTKEAVVSQYADLIRSIN